MHSLTALERLLVGEDAMPGALTEAVRGRKRGRREGEREGGRETGRGRESFLCVCCNVLLVTHLYTGSISQRPEDEEEQMDTSQEDAF